MKHRFYEKPESEQKRFLWKVGILLFLISGSVLVISYLAEFYFLVVLLPLVLLVAAPFMDLPMGRKSGKFIYYSPVFITEKEKNDRIIVHGGTLFDYYFSIDPDLSPKKRTQTVLYGYIYGLSELISEYEQQYNENLRIRGTTYIMNQRTAERFGFKTVNTDLLQLIILLLNYIPLTISYSFLKKRVQFPNISEIKTYEVNMSELIEHKERLIHLKNRLAVD